MGNKRPRTHYDNLQVAKHASPEVIKAAYRGLSQRYHPDKNIGDRQEAGRIMRLINEAYEVLSDRERRAQHDRWIADMDGGGAHSSAVPGPLKAGNVSFGHLPREIQQRLQDRSKGRVGNQLKVPIGGVLSHYLWVVCLCGWFWLLFMFARSAPWSAPTTTVYGALTLVVAVFLGSNTHALLRCFFSPLKRDFILTPIYFIRTWNDDITYWPIWELKDVHVTHRYQNGIYMGSDTSMQFAGETLVITIRGEGLAQKFLEQLRTYERQARLALAHNNVDFFLKEDDFRDVEPPPPKSKRGLTSEALAGYGISILTAALLFSVAYNVNLHRALNESTQAEHAVLNSSSPCLTPGVSFCS